MKPEVSMKDMDLLHQNNKVLLHMLNVRVPDAGFIAGQRQNYWHPESHQGNESSAPNARDAGIAAVSVDSAAVQQEKP